MEGQWVLPHARLVCAPPSPAALSRLSLLISALADVLQRSVAPRLKRIWFGTGSPRDESCAYSSLPFAQARRGWLGVGGAPRLVGINALAKHTAWNATDESTVRVEGGRF